MLPELLLDTSWLEYQIPEVDTPTSAPLLAQMQEGDELWTYSSPQETLNGLGGEAGLAVVRKGLIVAHVVMFGD